MAKIGIETTRPFLSLTSTRPLLELSVEEPQLQIHSPRPVLHIDQKQCFADAGRRTPSDFSAYYAAQGWSDSMQGIARRASEGDLLGQINKGYGIADLAAEGLGSTIDFNVTSIPKQPPRTWVETYPVQFKFIRGSVSGTFHPGKIENNFQWGKVQIYLRQQNHVSIKAVGDRLDATA